MSKYYDMIKNANRPKHERERDYDTSVDVQHTIEQTDIIAGRGTETGCDATAGTKSTAEKNNAKRRIGKSGIYRIVGRIAVMYGLFRYIAGIMNVEAISKKQFFPALWSCLFLFSVNGYLWVGAVLNWRADRIETRGVRSHWGTFLVIYAIFTISIFGSSLIAKTEPLQLSKPFGRIARDAKKLSEDELQDAAALGITPKEYILYKK